MTEPEHKRDTPHSKHSAFAAALRDFVLAMRQMLSPSEWALRKSRRQHDAEAHIRAERAEAEIRARYPNAIYQAEELGDRARRHGVIFAPYATPHHQAALLDMLDNPTASSPITYMHMTWVTVIDPATGRSTVSGTHPAVRALYRWTAQHVHAMRANPDDPNSIRTVQQIRAGLPLDRVDWTESQWRVHEQRDAELYRAERDFFKDASLEPRLPRGRRRIRPENRYDT